MTDESTTPETEAPPADNRSIYKRLAAVAQRVKGVDKKRTNAHGKYQYASHVDITEAVREAYFAEGVMRTATVASHEVLSSGALLLVVDVRWHVTEGAPHCHTMRSVGIAPVAKQGQAPGIALSYAVKVAEQRTLMLLDHSTPDADSTEADARDPRQVSEAYAEMQADIARCETTEALTEASKRIKANFDGKPREALLKEARAKYNTLRGTQEDS